MAFGSSATETTVRQAPQKKIPLACGRCRTIVHLHPDGTRQLPTALITGSSRGIGRATALALGRAGYRVLATMRDPSAARELADVARREALPIELSPLDVDSDASVREAIGRLERAHGTPDVLINNAGVVRHGSIEETPIDDFRAAMETNFLGAIRCIQAVLPGMRARRSGCIVNISSVAGRVVNPPMGPYAASKFAVEAMSEALAQEVRPFGIRVVVVEPGVIDTAMPRSVTRPSDRSIYPHGKRMAGYFTKALQTPVSPDVVAQAIRDLLASDEQRFRYPVGPDAAPLLEWRASLTDEEFIAHGAGVRDGSD